MKESEVTDPEIKQFLEHIKKHPKFLPEGTIEESYFYNQPDGSNLFSAIRLL